MYNYKNKAQQSKHRVHISWDILYFTEHKKTLLSPETLNLKLSIVSMQRSQLVSANALLSEISFNCSIWFSSNKILHFVQNVFKKLCYGKS